MATTFHKPPNPPKPDHFFRSAQARQVGQEASHEAPLGHGGAVLTRLRFHLSLYSRALGLRIAGTILKGSHCSSKLQSLGTAIEVRVMFQHVPTCSSPTHWKHHPANLSQLAPPQSGSEALPLRSVPTAVHRPSQTAAHPNCCDKPLLAPGFLGALLG